ncbi:MAG: fumarate reductase cytochrome b subunit [Azoarcus sp.]|nr:fumarate reductase cytochrome b subunit [Azoarcus sp.]
MLHCVITCGVSMSYEIVAAQAGLSSKATKNHWPAWLDILQGSTGLFLALFMWGHMAFVASILLGETAMWTVTRLFEGYFIFGRSYPGLVSCAVAFVALAFVAHALLAVRKFPVSYRQCRTILSHAKAMRHEDSALWIVQVCTGFLLFFFVSAHLYQMFVWPQNIGPYASADRVWSDGLWPFYLTMLLAVELHGGIGLYRLAVKWGWPNVPRAVLKTVKWGLTAFFLVLGLATLAAYMKIGFDHRAHYGERYTPERMLEDGARREGGQ